MKADDLPPRANPLLASWQTSALRFTDRFVIAAWRSAPEQQRHARLIIRFGFLGFVFGMAYALFYWCIAHYWGAGIILICSVAFGLTPFLLRATAKLPFAGNLLAAIMTFGFTALCAVEGGMRGHAVAWLASVPLCALLVAGKDSARVWAVICFAVVSLAVVAEIKGIALPITYDPAWHALVNSAGYAGLIVFMFALGMIFETSRERAFLKMEEALQQLAQSNEKLVTLNKEKTEFLGIVSHDLRNPLTTVIAFSQIMEENERPAEVPKMSRAIHAAGARMRDLITNLLDANAVEEGRFSCKFERCEVDALIAQSIENNQMNATRKKIALEVETQPGLAIKADKSTTVQVLDNLLSNAIKYSPLSTTVRIRASNDDGQILIAFQDEGPGLSQDDQVKLFRKFTRLSAQPTGGESSTGLGLSIVKRMVEAMSGSVSCESVLGRGATFTLRLPRSNEKR